MKKYITFCIIVILLICLSLPVSANETEFNPIWPIPSCTHIGSLDRYKSGSLHGGIDIPTTVVGKEVVAVADGTVSSTKNVCSHISAFCGCGGGWGNYITIEHVVNGVTYYSRYAHLTLNSIKVKKGDAVKEGQLLGLSGSSGDSSGPHLHLEIFTGTDERSNRSYTFKYYISNPKAIDGICIAMHNAENSVHFGQWIEENCTLNGECYIFDYVEETCSKTQYRYYHYTDKNGHYSVCGRIIGSQYGTMYRHSTDWMDSPLTNMVSNSATSYQHVRDSSCTTYNCTDETWYNNGAWQASCSECGVSNAKWFRVETRTVESHNYTSSVTKAATCTATGVKTYTCADCEDSYTETIAALGHSYASAYTTDKAATCISAGSKSQHCTRSGCTAKQNVTTIPATGHNYSVTTAAVAATCTASGKTAVETCSTCKTTKGGAAVAALGHSYASAYTTDKAATCTAAGSKSQHCTRSGCTAKQNVITIPATGHNYSDWVVTTPAQIGVKGEETRTCPKCSATEKRDIPALEAVIPDEATVISASKVRGTAGSTVKVEVAIEKNDRGFGGMAFEVGFDNTKLTLTAIEKGDAFSGIVTNSVENANQVGNVYFSYAGLSNISGNGVIATLTFTVNDGVEECTSPITVSTENSDAFYYDDYEMVDLELVGVSGEVNVIDVIPGDTNGDGAVTVRDAALILQYKAGWNVRIDLAAADTNGDGEVSVRDAALILQYKAGWNVTLG